MTRERIEQEPRELTNFERTAIRKLVLSMCANYDKHYNVCAKLGCACYMLSKWWTGSYCKYFQNAVLPLEPVLEAALTDRNNTSQKTCPVCGAAYISVTSKTYCSPACQKEGNRRRSRERMRKKRQNQ